MARIAGVAILVATAAVACAHEERGPGRRHDLRVIAIDRTGVVASEGWSTDVASQVMATVDDAIESDVESVDLIGLGTTPGDTQRLAHLDLTAIDGNTSAKRAAAREEVVAAAGAATRHFAREQVTTNGTDVVAALAEAAALCTDDAVSSCSILLASDLEDQRVTGAASVDAAVEALEPLMPSLDGIPVSVTGLGASGSESALVTKVAATWEELLHRAGATDVRIARSL